MSLLSSIFGEAQGKAASKDKGKGTSPDLFGAKLSVPPILHKKSLPTKKKGKNKAEDVSNEKNGESKPSDESSSEQPSPEDASQNNNSAAAAAAAATSTTKTKEQLEEEEGRTVFVGNLPPDISRRALAGIFKPCGKVDSARLRSMAVTGVKLPPEQAGNQNMMRKVCANTGKILADTPKKSAQGYVVFESVESIEKALQLNNTTYQSHTIRVDHANPTIEPSRSVFVGNLPYHADEEKLREHFLVQLSEGEDLNEREGCAVSGVRIIRDKETQKCKGFGYVMLRDATLVPLALQLHETTFMKRELRVMVCGKRFKGNRGDDDHSKGDKSGRRSFEGRRATGDSSMTRSQSSKRKSEEGAASSSSSAGNGGGKVKRRRARSEKWSAPGAKSGMSKRAVTEKKVNKRVKKLQQRAVKGMGKKKN
ncbi:hypothetical protein ACHAXR_002483 [Thalassiosira sp. AJA248-18]